MTTRRRFRRTLGATHMKHSIILPLLATLACACRHEYAPAPVTKPVIAPQTQPVAKGPTQPVATTKPSDVEDPTASVKLAPVVTPAPKPEPVLKPGQFIARKQSPEHPQPGDLVSIQEFHSEGVLATERTERVVLDGAGKPQQVRQGPMRAWHLNGKLKIEGGYDSEGKLTGHWRYFDDQGQLQREGDYADGMREGDWIEIYPNGKPQRRGFIHVGLLEGPWKHWYDNGQLEAEGEYANNKREGTWLFYFPDGKPDAARSGRYVNHAKVE